MITEYAKEKRKEAASIARLMLSGKMDYLEGSQRLSTISSHIEIDDDEDFKVFELIDSETDALPIGRCRENWNPQRLIELQPEYERSVEWAKKLSLKNCESIVERFSA